VTRSDVLVSTDWAERNLDTDHVVFVEVDEDTGAYDTGHIPGAVKLDWKIDLQDPIKRDFVDTQQFSKLLSARGISRDDTVVLYGGNNNWFAVYAYWYFKLYGHDKIKLLDGGRKKWELDGRPLSGAINVPWSRAANEDGTFKSDEELAQIYATAGLNTDLETIVYCRIGERSSHTWFVLQELLGHQNVKNYDGSWTEYGSPVGAPIELGS